MQQEKIVVVLVLILSLLGYDYFFQHGARAIRVRALKSEVERKNAEIQEARAAEEALPKLKAELDASRQLIATLLEQLPQKSQIGLLLNQVIQVAPRRGFTFDIVNPQSIKNRTEGAIQYEELEMSARVRAGYSQIGQYVAQLEKLPRLVEIGGFDIRKVKTGEPPVVTFLLKTFFMAAE